MEKDSRFPSGRDEAARGLLVGLIFVVYWFLILEGVLRKWAVPALQGAFFFIRVPLTLVLYWAAWRSSRWPRSNGPLLIAYVLAALGLVLVPFQMIAGGYDASYLLLAGYGWINYFLYIPLAFLIAEQFRREDLHRMIRHTLWLAIPAALLVVLQFRSPAAAPINLGSALDEPNRFRGLGAALGFIRPTGFFTSALGQAQFVASAAALVLAGWLAPRGERPSGRFLLFGGTAAVLVLALFSESRGLFFQIGILLIAAVAAGVSSGKKRIIARAAFGSTVVVGTVAALWPIVFPEAFRVFVARWTEAWGQETGVFLYGIFGRALQPFYAFLEYLHSTPSIGYLLGFGGNASLRLDWVILPKAAYTWTGFGLWGLESGWAVHLIELGLFAGLAFIFFRIGLTLWVGWKAFASARRCADPLPFLLFGYVGVVLLIGQITVQGTVNGYAWMFLGFCLSAIRTAEGKLR